MLPTQCNLIFLACSGLTTSCSAHTVSTAFSSNSDAYSKFHYFLLIDDTIKFSFEGFSIVSSYIAQFRNLSETDFINNLTGRDHIHVYVVIHFYFIGLTQDHFNDAIACPLV